MNLDQKLLETVFLMTGDKWQPKTLFLTIFDLHLHFQLPPIRCDIQNVYLRRFILGYKVRNHINFMNVISGLRSHVTIKLNF